MMNSSSPVSRLLECQNLSNLTHLNISFIDPNGMKKLGESPNLTNLKRLMINHSHRCAISQQDFRVFCNSANFCKLTELQLHCFENQLFNAIEILTESEIFKSGQLTSLRLHGPVLRYTDVRYLVENSKTTFSNLKTLHCEVHDMKSIQLLASCSQFQQLTSLGLSYCQLEDDSVAALIDSNSCLKSLHSLHFAGNCISFKGVRSLMNFQNLELFDLQQNPIEVEGAKIISLSEHMKTLTYLDLSSCRIGDEGLMYLTQSQYLSKLNTLILARNHLGPKGAHYLAETEWRTFPNLTYLDMKDNWFGDSGLLALATCEIIKNLKELFLTHLVLGTTSAEYLFSSDNSFGKVSKFHLKVNKCENPSQCKHLVQGLLKKYPHAQIQTGESYSIKRKCSIM
ncbi:hypothetical protein C9374_013928 [Naegleria lovaniensis]|uniref:Uncharacterized protein n=1 Tax=Naegleria lovaniensis TaxID=51637 RepID=A0AA88H1N1_NAELO|nr:uncharacterized protein C9374_013928 [Naegleria lovaniensis]KAG2389368.1 hypothetical protein C9374_013928 [Naegleria lovaniensis]